MSRRVPKYRRHPNGQAFVQHQGRRYYLGKYGEEQSRKRYGQFIARLATSEPASAASSDSPTITKLIQLYGEAARSRYYKDGQPTKEFKGILSALRVLEILYGEEPGKDFGPSELEAVQENLVARNYARTSINKQIGRIKRFFRWCSKKHVPRETYYGLLCVESLMKGRSIARESKDVEPVPHDVVLATVPWLSPHVAAMALGQLLCGMRPQDVCRLRGAEMDARGETWIFRPKEHKNAWRGQQRIIAIPPVAQKVLKPFIKADPLVYWFSPREAEAWRNEHRHPWKKEHRKTPIYPSELRFREKRKARLRKRVSKRPKRERYDSDSYRRAIKYGIQKANKAGVKIPHWFPHQMRHTISTEISQTIGEQAAQRWLGHARLETTGLYTQKQISELLEIARQLESHWAAKAESPPAPATEETQKPPHTPPLPRG